MNASAQSGYATITVMALIMSLSIIAIAYLNLVSAKSAKALETIESARLDAALEGALHQTLAVLTGQSQTLASIDSIRFAEVDIIIDAEREADKTDINRAPLEAIEERLNRLKFSPAEIAGLTRHIRDKRMRPDPLISSLDELFKFASSARSAACLRQHLTVFHSPSKPKRNRDKNLDGTLIRFRLSDADERRGLDSIILFTGIQNDPVWTMSWRTFIPNQERSCEAGNA